MGTATTVNQQQCSFGFIQAIEELVIVQDFSHYIFNCRSNNVFCCFKTDAIIFFRF